MPRPRRPLCRPLSRPSSRRLRARLLVVPAAVLVLGAAGCSGGGSHAPAAGPTSPPTPTPTPLAQVRTTELTVGRAGFCPRVAPDAVDGALGSEPTRSERWRNGQRAALAPGLTDVAHEFGCRWTSGTGASAAAWVFAPPITATEGGRLRADALATAGCHAVPDVPRFGRPTVAVRCTDHGATTVALHGLFGDAWLSCSLTEPNRPNRPAGASAGPTNSSPASRGATGGSPAATGSSPAATGSSPAATGSSGAAPTGSSPATTGSPGVAPTGSLIDRTEQWCVSVALAAAV